MDNHEMLRTYETLTELSGVMLHAARAGQWDHLAELEQRCRGHVTRLMHAAPVALDETEQRARNASIRAILQNDAEIRALVEPRLDELQQRLHAIRTGRQGMQAYAAQGA